MILMDYMIKVLIVCKIVRFEGYAKCIEKGKWLNLLDNYFLSCWHSNCIYNGYTDCMLIEN
jgi:hypothetical protein